MSQLPDTVTKNLVAPAFEKVWKPETLAPVVSTNGFRKLELKLDSSSRIVFHSDPSGVAVEQYRMLRHSLAEHFPQGGVLLVSSPAKGDGKTTNAINLAWCLAESSSPTLLAEFDLRQPSIANVLGYRPNPGIESALVGGTLPESVVGAANGLPLHVAAVAQAQREPVRTLKGSATKHFMEWARAKFRWIVIDAPPVMPAADVAEVAPLTDAVLMVVRVRHTPRELVNKSFGIVGSRLRGVIVNEATRCSDSYYRYLSGYHAT